jgi:hypothetical protein
MPDKAPRARASAVLVLLGCSVAALSACSALPTDGQVHTSSLSTIQNGVQVTSRAWSASMTPVEVVKNFQQATAGDDDDPAFTTAQTYLTSEAASAWIPPKGSWAGETHIYDHLAWNGPSTIPDTAKTTVVTSGNLVASVDADGYYQAQDPATNSQTYTLTQVAKGSWKISSAPPFRLVALDDFRRTTPAPLPVYQVVPAKADARVAQQIDQVYLLKSAGHPEYTYQKLADALLAGRDADPAQDPATGQDAANSGPDPDPAPGRGTGSAMKASVKLDPNGGVVTVTLDGPLPEGWQYQGLATAMVQTFQAASAPQAVPSPVSGFSTLLLMCARGGGRPAQFCTNVAAGAAGIDTALPQGPVVYYASGDHVFGASDESPKGDGSFTPRQVAVALGDGRTYGALAVKKVLDKAAPPVVVAASVTDGRDAGYVVVAHDGDTKSQQVKRWYKALGKVTSLDWDPVDGSLWVVDNGSLYNVREPQGDAEQSTGPLPVLPRTMAPGSLVRFKLSPDGREAAVVTGSTQDLVTKQVLAQAWMVPLLRAGAPATTVPALGDGYPLLADLKSVTDVSWAGRRALVLLGTDKAGSDPKLYQVYADGSQDDTLLGATADAESSSSVIAAQGVDAGTPKFRIFSDGAASADGSLTLVYWKGLTFDPVYPPPQTAPSASSTPSGSQSKNQKQSQAPDQPPSQLFPTLATVAQH